MLAPRRTFDHAINLKEGAEPPWGPIYPMSAHQLKELDKYLKKMRQRSRLLIANPLTALQSSLFRNQMKVYDYV